MKDIRQLAALDKRRKAALLSYHLPWQSHMNNGEENDYRNSQNQLNYIANFTKGLPHDFNTGEVFVDTYKTFLRQLYAGDPQHLHIKLGLSHRQRRLLVNPFAGLAFDLEGPDCASLTLPPAPRINSAQAAAEMGELYWMALLRDIHFSEFSTNSLIQQACFSLASEFPEYHGLKDSTGRVTPDLLFRGITRGDTVGPYVSQFLLRGSAELWREGIIKYGSLQIQQKQKTILATKDYMTTWNSFMNVQNGLNTAGQDQFDSTPRFIRNMRDLANYVHFDQLYQAYLNACFILLTMGVSFDAGNPYINSKTQQGFVTFGPPHILTLLAEVSTRALKAVWHQKWFVHRRLRPEAFAGFIHRVKTGQAGYPIHQNILRSSVLEKIYQYNQTQNGHEATYLLPQVYPEGAPLHPSYGAGHATLAGACATILKAFFDESFCIADPVVANPDGTQLVPYKQSESTANGSNTVEEIPNNNAQNEEYVPPEKKGLTVGGELNKLVSNISIGRNMAGVHYFSDYSQAIKLGEAVAIQLLREQKVTLREEHFFSLTTFEGTGITI